MGYDSVNTFPRSVRREEVEEVLFALGYERYPRSQLAGRGEIGRLFWFEDRDYRSYSGVLVTLQRDEGKPLKAYTRTPIACSYWDFRHQNRTMRLLRKWLGGDFESDAGKNRCPSRPEEPAAPAEAGCYLAFERFGHNLFLIRHYLDGRAFPNNEQWEKLATVGIHYNPRVLSNNLLLPFVVSAMEDYFRSAYVALLRYSPRKDQLLKGARISGDKLVSVAGGDENVEQAVAGMRSFQDVSSVCEQFKALDSRLDFARELHRPFRRRKRTLFESIGAIVSMRHALVHRATVDVELDEADLEKLLEEVEQAVTRCHNLTFKVHGWELDIGWSQDLFGAGNRRRLVRQAKRPGDRLSK